MLFYGEQLKRKNIVLKKGKVLIMGASVLSNLLLNLQYVLI